MPAISRDKLTLSSQQLALLNSEMTKAKRSTGLAYFLYFLLNPFGAHQFYLRDVMMGVLYIVLACLSISGVLLGLILAKVAGMPDRAAAASSFMGGIVQIVAAFVWGIIGLYDLFTLPSQVRDANDLMEAKLIQEIKEEAPDLQKAA